jgi:formylglycine-generating enzyme required for sulfatase activity
MKGPNIQKTVKVGNYQPNPWGLYDMHGNVAEWVEDWYTDSYKGLKSDGSANLAIGNGEYRVLRGGSWFDDGNDVRSALRIRNLPSDEYVHFAGFRVVARPK